MLLKKSFREYIDKSLYFIYIAFFRWLFVFVSIFAGLFFISILNFFFVDLNLIKPHSIILEGILLFLFLIMYIFFYASFKGAMIKKYENLLHKGKIRLKNYLRNAIDMGFGYFVIEILGDILKIIPFVISFGILFYIKQISIIFLAAAFLISLVPYLIFDFLVNVLYFVYAVYRAGLRNAIITAKNIIRYRFKELIVWYLFSLIVKATFLIPFLNLVTAFVLHPVSYVYGILIVKRK